MARFALSAFLRGMGRTLDVGATFNSKNLTADVAKTDAEALASDWEAVNSDFHVAASGPVEADRNGKNLRGRRSKN